MKKVPGHPVAQEIRLKNWSLIQVSTLWNRSASLGVESMRSRHENAPGLRFDQEVRMSTMMSTDFSKCMYCKMSYDTVYMCIYIYII